MRAAIKSGKERFDIIEVDRPSAGANEVLVDIHYCLICAWCYEEWLKDSTENPLGPGVSGHEVSGVVQEVGNEVTNYQVGDRVLVYDLLHCGECEACLAGRETFCNQVGSLHQGYAEYLSVPKRNLLPVPDSLHLKSAGMVGDMVGTSMRAIRRAFEVDLPRKVCAVWGLGPVGLVAIQGLRTLAGVEKVIALDPLANRRQMALDLGADRVLDPTNDRTTDELKTENGNRGCDYAFNCAIRSEEVLNTVMSTVRRDGYLMNLTGAAKSWPQYELRVDGSFYFWKKEYEENAKLVTSGKIQVTPIVSHEFPLAEINAAMDMRANHPGVSLKVAVRCQD